MIFLEVLVIIFCLSKKMTTINIKNKVLNKRFFQLAKRASLESNEGKYRIGCVIVKNGNPITFGWNKYNKRHTLCEKYGNQYNAIHAELDAIIGTDRNTLIGSTIYVYREDRNGQLGMCRPCNMCMSVLKQYGVKKVYYTHSEGFSYEKI